MKLSLGLIWVLALPPLLGGCGQDASADTSNKRVEVFAAASLKEAMADLAKHFEADHPGTNVTFNFGGSQELAEQIKAGAPMNVFVSADYAQMQVAASSGRIPKQAIQEMAENSLAIAAWPRSKVHEIQDLAAPHTHVVIADAKVPAGVYARQTLDKLQTMLNKPDFATAVMKNVVSYEQDVRSVLQKVELGEADAGIVYRTDAAATHGKVRTITIPAAANVTGSYWIAEVDQWYDTAKSFVNYTRSPDGQKILQQHGFLHYSK